MLLIIVRHVVFFFNYLYRRWLTKRLLFKKIKTTLFLSEFEYICVIIKKRIILPLIALYYGMAFHNFIISFKTVQNLRVLF